MKAEMQNAKSNFRLLGPYWGCSIIQQAFCISNLRIPFIMGFLRERIFLYISWDFSPQSTMLAWWNRPFRLIYQSSPFKTCFLLRTQRSVHENCVRRTTVHENFIFTSCFLQSLFSNISRNVLKPPAKMAIPKKMWSF